MRYLGSLIFAVMVLIQLPSARAAVLYDPDIHWRTIMSPRFAVHYPEGGRNLAVRVSRIAEEVMGDVSAMFGFMPEGQIEIVLTDNSDDANGSAQVMPKNILRLYLSAPTELAGLSAYDDWLRILLIHELAHICDIDQTQGVTRFFRWIFGKYVALNGYTPQFLSEGVAVYAETMLTKTGRGRSTYVKMLLREAALEKRFLSIDQANVRFADWPAGYASYFYGGMFHLWLANKYGSDAVRDLHRRTATAPIPYLYWFASEFTFGRSLPDLWDDWRHEEERLAQDVANKVREQGETKSTPITHHGRNVTGAHYSPDGAYIAYSRSSPIDGGTVRRISRDGTQDAHLVLQTYSSQLSFAPDGAGIYYSQSAINERFNNFDDLYYFDIAKDSAKRWRDAENPDNSLRARDPDVSPDGKFLVFVQNEWHQNRITRGEIINAEKGELKLTPLVPAHGDVQHASPRISPDGKWVAVSSWFEGGFRDIVIIDANTGALKRRVTIDRAQDGNPEWSPDGRYVLYESDASGISNIYAYDTEEERYYRVTNVVGGAFQPDVAPDGKTLIFRRSDGDGFDIHEMPFASQDWTPLSYGQEAGYQPFSAQEKSPSWAAAGYALGVNRQNETPLELKASEEDRDYEVGRTLAPFQDNWILIPSLYFFNNDPSFRLATFGADTLIRHSYALSVGGSWYTMQGSNARPNWSASYSNDVWYPTFSIGAGDLGVSRIAKDDRYTERQLTGVTSFSMPLKQRHSIVASYVFENRQGSPELTKLGLRLGNFAWVSAGYQYRFVRRFPYSVSDEHGRSLSFALRGYSKALGGDFDEWLMVLDGRTYINNPLFDNHVLALRLVAAAALGPDFYETFVLGGNQGTSVFTVQAERTYPLRGFMPNLNRYPAGTGMLAGYAEYRFPIWNVQHGLWTLPVFVERLHAGVFFDVGNAFGTGREKGAKEVLDAAWQQIRRIRAGAGVELRADLSLGWALPLTLRVGVGAPVLQAGRGDLGLPQYYFSFGTSI